MLVLVALFLILLAVAATAVWLYRQASNQQDFDQETLANSGTITKRWLKAQQSFSSLASSTRENAKHTTLPHSKDDIKAPWGW